MNAGSVGNLPLIRVSLGAYFTLILLVFSCLLLGKISLGVAGFFALLGLPLFLPIIRMNYIKKTLKEKERAKTELRNLKEKLKILKELGEILNYPLNLELIIKKILGIIESKQYFDGCAIWSYDTESCQLKLVTQVGVDNFHLQEEFKGDLELRQRIFKEKGPLFTEDLKDQLLEKGLFFTCKQDIKTIMLQPIFDEHLPLGLIALFSFDDKDFTDQEKDFLRDFFALIALSIRNAWLYTRVYEQSIIDDLTGLYNHRFLMRRLKEEVERAIRLDHPLSILILDLDDFKIFNDTFGHLEGNRILALFGKKLRNGVRNIDIPGRFGGEEFVIILPETDIDAAAVIGRRLLAGFKSHSCFKDDQGKALITCSIGGAALSKEIQTATQLLDQADMMLYKAKQEKDCLVVDE